jgi:hypothetical protein
LFNFIGKRTAIQSFGKQLKQYPRIGRMAISRPIGVDAFKSKNIRKCANETFFIGLHGISQGAVEIEHHESQSQSFLKPGIINQPRLSDKHRQGHLRADGNCRDGHERFRIEKFHIIQSRVWLAFNLFLHVLF